MNAIKQKNVGSIFKVLRQVFAYQKYISSLSTFYSIRGLNKLWKNTKIGLFFPLFSIIKHFYVVHG